MSGDDVLVVDWESPKCTKKGDEDNGINVVFLCYSIFHFLVFCFVHYLVLN